MRIKSPGHQKANNFFSDHFLLYSPPYSDPFNRYLLVKNTNATCLTFPASAGIFFLHMALICLLNQLPGDHLIAVPDLQNIHTCLNGSWFIQCNMINSFICSLLAADQHSSVRIK